MRVFASAVRLQATNGNLIKGFSVQARQATTEFDNRAPHIGRFVGGGFDWKLWPCDPGSVSWFLLLTFVHAMVRERREGTNGNAVFM